MGGSTISPCEAWEPPPPIQISPIHMSIPYLDSPYQMLSLLEGLACVAGAGQGGAQAFQQEEAAGAGRVGGWIAWIAAEPAAPQLLSARCEPSWSSRRADRWLGGAHLDGPPHGGGGALQGRWGVCEQGMWTTGGWAREDGRARPAIALCLTLATEPAPTKVRETTADCMVSLV